MLVINLNDFGLKVVLRYYSKFVLAILWHHSHDSTAAPK